LTLLDPDFEGLSHGFRFTVWLVHDDFGADPTVLM
jgi:hypothetical protein